MVLDLHWEELMRPVEGRPLFVISCWYVVLELAAVLQNNLVSYANSMLVCHDLHRAVFGRQVYSILPAETPHLVMCEAS